MDIALVLDKIRPNAAWRMADTYENLKATWEDKKQTLPTLEELESACADMNKGPTAAETKQAKVDALNATYDAEFEELSTSLGLASLANDADLIAELRTEYTDLKTAYAAELEVINNG